MLENINIVTRLNSNMQVARICI